MKQYPGKLISVLYRKSQVYWGHVLKDSDIATSEYPILIVLFKQDGITQEEIASNLSIDKSAIARVIKSLLEKGLIERSRDFEDRRCKRIYLTQKGHSSRELIEDGIKEWNRIISKDIPLETVEQVVAVMSQMVENLEHCPMKEEMDEEEKGQKE